MFVAYLKKCIHLSKRHDLWSETLSVNTNEREVRTLGHCQSEAWLMILEAHRNVLDKNKFKLARWLPTTTLVNCWRGRYITSLMCVYFMGQSTVILDTKIVHSLKKLLAMCTTITITLLQLSNFRESVPHKIMLQISYSGDVTMGNKLYKKVHWLFKELKCY